MATGLDGTDLRIIKALQENCKVTNIQLSNEVGLSPAPTLERVKKLESSGYIRSYHAMVDSEKIGLGLTALIQVALARQMDNVIQSFHQHIMEVDEIVECYQLTGDFDYMLKVIVEDIPAFEQLITEKLSKIEEIGQMQTNVVLSKIKDSPILPLDYEGGEEKEEKGKSE
ncbi:MAG: Lrp/AsnC family transcriptional regulator [Flavobacteriales bacterium]